MEVNRFVNVGETNEPPMAHQRPTNDPPMIGLDSIWFCFGFVLFFYFPKICLDFDCNWINCFQIIGPSCLIIAGKSCH